MSKKGENIYKRKDGRWESRYIKGYSPDGQARYGYCYGKTYREAKRKLIEAKSAQLLGAAPPGVVRGRRFASYCDEWLQLNRNRVKESTFVKYRCMLEKHVKPNLGGYLLQAINTITIERFSNYLLFDKKLSPKTVKDVLIMVHSILEYIHKQMPDTFPMVEIIYPKVPRQEMRVLSRDEENRFVNYLFDDMDEYKFGVLLALFTGMRIGEVCALRWESLSLADGTVTIRSTMQRLQNVDGGESARTKVVISEPKSESSARVIPLTTRAIALCRSRYCENGSAFVLTGESERYVEPRAMQYRLEKYTTDCGLDGVHFHTLRHSFATRCVEVDFEIKTLSEILGHSSPSITLDRYVHTSMKLKRDNMNKLSSIGF